MATTVNIGSVDSAFGASPRTVSVPFTPTAGNSLIVYVNGGSFTGTRSFSDDGGNTWVQDYTATSLQVYRCASIGSVPTTLTATWDGGSSGVIGFKVFEVSGLDGAGPDNTYATASTAWGADQATSVTTDESDDYVISLVELNASRDSPFTAVGSGLAVHPTSGTGLWWGAAHGTLSASPTTTNAGISVSPNISGSVVTALVYSSGASAPTISNTTPATIKEGSNPVITGTNFGSSQGAGTVKISPTDNIADAAVATQAITAWGDTEITLNGVTFPTGTSQSDTLYVFVTNNDSASNAAGYAVTASLAPTIHTGTVVNPSAGGFSVRFTSDVGNGTAYYVVFQTTASDPSAAQIVAGTDGDGGAAVASGSMAISTTGEQTFPATTGLTQSVTYRVAVVHYGDSSA